MKRKLQQNLLTSTIPRDTAQMETAEIQKKLTGMATCGLGLLGIDSA